jgi:hypothetical protein
MQNFPLLAKSLHESLIDRGSTSFELIAHIFALSEKTHPQHEGKLLTIQCGFRESVNSAGQSLYSVSPLTHGLYEVR